MKEKIRLITKSFKEHPALDIAISGALLASVSAGNEPQTLRIYRPGRIVAFGPQDRLSSGYENALRLTRSAGFTPLTRLSGGTAAVFHENSIAFAWAIADPEPRAHAVQRFITIANIMFQALRKIGIDSRIGLIPGEYCPGKYSVNARGRKKLVGVGQKIKIGGSHVGGVVVVNDANLIQNVLVQVYDALNLNWDPSTVGSVAEEIGHITYESVVQSVLEEFSISYNLIPGDIGAATLKSAQNLITEYSEDQVSQ